MAAAQPPKQFILNSAVPKNISGTVYLSYPDVTGKWKTDSCIIKDAGFQFKGTINHPVLARLYFTRKDKEIFLEPAAMTIILDTANLSRSRVTGSKAHREFEELNAALQKIKSRWKTVLDTLSAVNRRSNAAFQELKGWVLGPYFEEIRDANLQFFDKHSGSVVAAYSLQNEGRELSTDTLKLFYNRLSPLAKQSIYGRNINVMLEQRKIGMPGTIAHVFEKKDINGSNISLANYKGNSYVLLDFWGSWCVPCRKGHPHMRELYTKYKDRGIEFIGIADDDATPDAWRKAVINDSLSWPQVLRGPDREDNLSQKYNVIYYPTKILIDKAGKIIGRYSENMDELDKMLEKIF